LTVDAWINGKFYVITLDTGASHSIIKKELIQEAIEPLPGVKLKTATGEKAEVLGSIQRRVTIGGKSVNHEFLVAAINDDVILGLDFMEKHNFTLDLKSRILKYYNLEIPLETGYNRSLMKNNVTIVKDERIPPYSEAIVWAKVEGNNNTCELYVVDAETNKNVKNNVIIGKTLVKLNKQGKVPVRMLNLASVPVLLRRGEIVGQCQEVSLITNCEEKSKEEVLQNDDNLVGYEHLRGLSKKQRLKAGLLLNEFQSIFAASESKNGRTAIVQHKINTNDAVPIRQVPRRVPLAKRDEVSKMIEDMHQDKVIEPSESPWCSPVVLVKKKDGSTRFCVDYRKLNDVTKKDSYPLPRIDDTLDTLSGSKWFSTLDLKSGYWQVEIKKEDREKTAFSCGSGLWQFAVMPFGLCNAPATFERLMERVLRGLHWKTCLVYLDDIIILGRDFDEHIKNLKEVFERIKNAGLKLSAKKCSLFKREVKYLGHKISMDGVHTDEDKIKAVRDWPRPKNISEVRSFIGLCTYYRRFVPNFATEARSLHDLTKKNAAFNWTDLQEKAFITLKKKMCEAPILAYPVPGERFILDTDACSHGIGSVLSQIIEGEEKVIAYYSRTLSKPEINYCVTRKELLAIVDSIKNFHKYLYGSNFLIRTDHAALKWLLQFKNPEGQVARWIEILQNYDFTIEHRKGEQHKNADSLSRRPCNLNCKHCFRLENKEGAVDVKSIEIVAEWTPEQIKDDQKQDTDLVKIITAKERDERPDWKDISKESPVVKAYWAQWQSLHIINGCLYRQWESEDGKYSKQLVVVPSCKISNILEEYHNNSSGGHLGVNKTLQKIKERFYWVGCHDSVRDWVAKCEQCSKAKGPRTRSHGKMQQYLVGAPFERVALDIAGPFPESNCGNKYVLVVMDYFSKWPEVYAIPNQEAKTIADVFINNWICRFGVPMELHSDQGRNFESMIFKEVCEKLGIKKTRTTPLHPQSDGMVERFNRTLEEHLKKVVDKNQKDWDEHIALFLMAYRSSIHDTTSTTPAKAVFGCDLRLPADLKFGIRPEEALNEEDFVSRQRRKLAEIHNDIRIRSKMQSDKMKARYDVRINSSGFQEGNLVLLYNPQKRKKLCPKLQTNWEGPYTIIKRINDVVYRIQRTGNTRAKMKVVHLERLTEFKGDAAIVRDEQI